MESNTATKIKLPIYPKIDNIKISQTVLSNIIKYCEESENNKINGLLYGFEQSTEINITSVFPVNPEVKQTLISNATQEIIRDYLYNNRESNMKIGYFFTEEISKIFTTENLEFFINCQKLYPNFLFFVLDYELFKNDKYGFSCYRLNDALITKVDEIDVEMEHPDISNVIINSDNLLTRLNFSVIEDIHTLNLSLNLPVSSKSLENFNRVADDNSILLQKNIKKLLKSTENFVEEQKKYIEYYKTKKQMGFANKNKEKDFLDMLNKKGSDLAKMKKIDIFLMSKNILSMNEKINALSNGISATNGFSLN